MMTLTRESEALIGGCTLSRTCHWPKDDSGEEVEDPTLDQWATVYHSGGCIRARRRLRASLEGIEAAVRAEQSAELAEVRDQLDALLANGPEPRVWLEYRREAREQSAEVERLRAALDSTDPLPEDAPVEDTRQRLYSSGWYERGAAIRAALAATPVAPDQITTTRDGDVPTRGFMPGEGSEVRGFLGQPDHREDSPGSPVAPAPAATERWTLVPGEDDDCPRCGRVKLRWVPPEYEPGGWVCDDCGWDSRDSRSVAPAPAATEPRP